MTKLVTIKKPDTVRLKGVKLDWTIEDGAAVRLTITDRRGNLVTLSRGESYERGFRVMGPKPVETAERFALVGEVSGVAVKGVFKTEHEAKNAMFDLNNGRSGDDISVQPIVVPVDEDGEVVTPLDEEIPF
jgi:hypothetical protein